jgi:hypothetical protein
MVANAERWADDGWGGLYGVDANAGTIFLAFNPVLSLEEAKESLKPLTDYFESVSSETAPYSVTIEVLPSHWAAQNTPMLLGFLASEAGVSLTRSSRLVPREKFQTPEGQAELVDVLVANGWTSILGTPTAFNLSESDLPGGPGYASVTPAWVSVKLSKQLPKLCKNPDTNILLAQCLVAFYLHCRLGSGRPRCFSP